MPQLCPYIDTAMGTPKSIPIYRRRCALLPAHMLEVTCPACALHAKPYALHVNSHALHVIGYALRTRFALCPANNHKKLFDVGSKLFYTSHSSVTTNNESGGQDGHTKRK